IIIKMPEQEQFKRNIAYKLRIGDILMGKPVLNGEKFSFLELGNKQIIRVNIIGNVIDKFESDSSSGKSYIFTKIDDGSGQISIKAFGDDIEKISSFTQGQTILCIGTLRYFNNETYISPEIIKNIETPYLLVRKLEIEKEKNQHISKISNKQETTAIRDKILKLIKDAEQEQGIEIDRIIMQIREASPDIINQEIKRMIEEGMIFEPRPGKVRWLG